jgi:hypothetical protein
MLAAVNRRIDDVAVQADAIEWLNEGKNKMAIAVGASFPDVENLTDSFVFDARFHGLPVLFASARYKEQDAVLSEAQNFLNQFYDGLKDFITKYEVPPIYREDHTTQQFTATSSAQTFTITKQTYNSVQGDLIVYINGIATTNFTINTSGTVTVWDVVAGNKVTMVWEEHVDLVQPPYSFWGRW